MTGQPALPVVRNNHNQDSIILSKQYLAALENDVKLLEKISLCLSDISAENILHQVTIILKFFPTNRL